MKIEFKRAVEFHNDSANATTFKAVPVDVTVIIEGSDRLGREAILALESKISKFLDGLNVKSQVSK